MGCDIHLHTEIKIDGEWRHWNAPRVERDYWLFGRMAGVRGHGPTIAEPRGCPNDTTFETKFDRERWDGDGHTHSWLSGNEVYELCKEYRERYPNMGINLYGQPFGYLFGNDWRMRDLPAGVTEARIVFWFDS